MQLGFLWHTGQRRAADFRAGGQVNFWREMASNHFGIAMKSFVRFVLPPVLCVALYAAEREGISPKDATGRELNLGFEDGSLKDWKATGKTFDGQPMKGDTVVRRLPGV